MTPQTSIRSAMKEISENSMKYSCQESKTQSKLYRTQSLLQTQFSITRLKPWRSMKAKALSKHQLGMSSQFRKMSRTIGLTRFHNFSSVNKFKLTNTQIQLYQHPKFTRLLPSSSINCWTYRMKETSTLPGSRTIEMWLMIMSTQWANQKLKQHWQVGSMWCQMC